MRGPFAAAAVRGPFAAAVRVPFAAAAVAAASWHRGSPAPASAGSCRCPGHASSFAAPPPRGAAAASAAPTPEGIGECKDGEMGFERKN